jgi:hypothetical protein
MPKESSTISRTTPRRLANPSCAGEAGLRFARTVTVSGAGRITCGAAHVDSVVDDFVAAFNSATLIL